MKVDELRRITVCRRRAEIQVEPTRLPRCAENALDQHTGLEHRAHVATQIAFALSYRIVRHLWRIYRQRDKDSSAQTGAALKRKHLTRGNGIAIACKLDGLLAHVAIGEIETVDGGSGNLRCEYLDEVVPQAPSFTPRDPVKRAAMRSLMRFIDEMPAAAVRVPTFNLAFLPRFAAMSEEEFVPSRRASLYVKEFMMAMGRNGFPQKEMDNALGRLRRTYESMDISIKDSGGPWLFGQNITLADISVMPALIRRLISAVIATGAICPASPNGTS